MPGTFDIPLGVWRLMAAPTALALFFAWRIFVKAQRKRAAEPAPLPNNVCIACDSAQAVTRLREARASLATAERLLTDALVASRIDIAGLSIDHGEAKQNAWTAAVRHMCMAEQLTRNAADLLKVSVTPELGYELADANSALLLSLDTSWLSDGLWEDITAHLRIKKAQAQVENMGLGVELLLERLTPPS